MRTVSGHRTKLLPQARAESFAKCLAARGQATDVQVLESNRTRSLDCRHFVYWTPKSVARQWALLDQSQNERAQRAVEQAGQYEFVLSDCGRYHYCLSLKTGEVYETTVHGCDCPDATYNLHRTGLRCKHALMLEAHLEREAEDLEIEREIEEAQEQDAAEKAEAEERDPVEDRLWDQWAEDARRGREEWLARERQLLSSHREADFRDGSW